MSVAFECPEELCDPSELDVAPEVANPGYPRLRATVRRDANAAAGRPRLASVTELRRPDERSMTAPVRLTRRGALVLGAVVAVLAGALITTAWVSAPRSATTSETTPTAATIVVRVGDSLWSVAERVAPNLDPRAEVAVLQRINQLRDSTLLPGQLLRTK